jgi:crotonobetainyl-CoA:carnitine CoA-transferase CaiB-like acyl-CoA transferase
MTDVPEDGSAAQQPFAGLRVVEFGQFVAVPFAAQLLAEGGAHVTKVEALEGDPTRRLRPLVPGETRTFLSRNRGKHSLPLALRDPAAKPVIDALLQRADVALMNFRPGLAEKLGLGARSLGERFPRLIVGTVTAFGNKGPEAGHAGMDIVVQARSGLMAANGRMIDNRPAAGDPVSADYMCAMTLAFGVSAALLRRERTGLGGSVDTSLMQAAMTLANNQLVRAETQDGAEHRAVLARLEQQRLAGASYAEQLAGMPSIRALPMVKVYFRTYETADAVIAIACGSHALRVKFIDAIGLTDPGLDAADDRDMSAHYDELTARAEKALQSKSSVEWIDLLQRVGVPVSAVKFPLELFDDPQAEANHMFHTLEHPTAGNVRVLSPPVRLEEDGFRPAPATAAFGSETESILLALGFSEAQIGDLVDANVTHRG